MMILCKITKYRTNKCELLHFIARKYGECEFCKAMIFLSKETLQSRL